MNPSEIGLSAKIAPSKLEWLAVAAVLVVLFAADLWTRDDYPAVWCDDITYSEPGINYATTGNFVTMVWQFQPLNTYPSVNPPLYPLAVAGWMKLAGPPANVRVLNYLLMGVAMFLLWVISWRFGLVRHAAYRLMLVVVAHLGYGVGFAYRCSRPDILPLVFLLLLVLAFGIESKIPRLLCLGLGAMVIPWVSLNTGLYVGFAGAVGWLLLRRPRFLELLVLAAGLVAGALTTFQFLKAQGVLDSFWRGASHVMGKYYAGDQGPVAKLLRIGWTSPQFVLGDFSAAVLLAGLVLFLLLGGWSRLGAQLRRVLILCVVLVALTPVLFNIVGHYVFYYAGLLYLPACLALFAGCSHASLSRDAPRRFFTPVLVTVSAVAVLVGLPLRIALATSFCHIASRGELQKIIDAHVSAEDVVFSDDTIFFEVKRRANAVYVRWSAQDFVHTRVPGREFTQAEKEAVSVLVIRPEMEKFCTNCFGGEWRAVTGTFGDTTDWERLRRLPGVGAKLAAYFDHPQNWRYPLQIFRRIRTPAASGVDPQLSSPPGR